MENETGLSFIELAAPLSNEFVYGFKLNNLSMSASYRLEGISQELKLILRVLVGEGCEGIELKSVNECGFALGSQLGDFLALKQLTDANRALFLNFFH